EALLDPTQLPVLDDLQLRISTAEAELDAVAGAIALKADTVRVDGIETELGSATVRIGSLETTIALKADRATLEDALTRLSTAEVRIETLDGANITQTVQDTRRQTDEIDTSAFQTFNDLWQGFREREALREGIAFAQSEIYASVNEQFAAEAGARE
ncbi:hypothetical protein, partial [Roseivivax isoporae]|uniref:hypothetical protein n=1 Tax=Roseivivax isoporae TaxID=591206 RepID=UPI0005C20C1E